MIKLLCCTLLSLSLSLFFLMFLAYRFHVEITIRRRGEYESSIRAFLGSGLVQSQQYQYCAYISGILEQVPLAFEITVFLDLLVFFRFLRLLLVCSCFYVKPGSNFRIFLSVHSLVHVHFHDFSYFSKLVMLESLSSAFFLQVQYLLFKMHTRFFKCKPGRCSADSSFLKKKKKKDIYLIYIVVLEYMLFEKHCREM